VLSIDGSTGGTLSTSSSLSSLQECRRPVTAQERQREREEKRRKRQERARERERKMKEKERREGRHGSSLGGVLLSDNDKSLLERWKKMMDGSGEPPVNWHQGGCKKADQEKGSSPEQTLKPQVVFQPAGPPVTLLSPPNPSKLAQPSATPPPLVSGFAAVVSVNDVVKGGAEEPPPPVEEEEVVGRGGLSCLGRWSSQPPAASGTTHTPPLPGLLPQAATLPPLGPLSFLNPHLLPLDRFLNKAPSSRDAVVLQNGLPHFLRHTAQPSAAGLPEKPDKPGSQTDCPSLCPSLGFSDVGLSGPCAAPDIHTVTLQLSKSQVGAVHFRAYLSGPRSLSLPWIEG